MGQVEQGEGRAEALRLADLITQTDGGIASRVLAKTGGGNVTLFAFDQGQGLSEHPRRSMHW